MLYGGAKGAVAFVVLGQARLLCAAGKRPLLLLDEVAAHLDADRRCGSLMAELLSLPAQSWISGTDLDALQTPETGDKSLIFQVDKGVVTLAK